jgi:hypothetical protein
MSGGPQIIVEISFVPYPFPASLQSWTDVSADVAAVPEIRRGRARLDDAMRAGTARIVLDNADGKYTPGNWASPYVDYLLPMRRVRIRVVWQSIGYTIFQGFIERWPPTYPGGLESTVELECSDWYLVFGSEPITLSRGAEYSHWRLIWLVSLTALSASERAIPTSGTSAGQSIVSAVSLVDTPILSHLQSVVEAEDGLLFVSGAGIVTFQGRHHRLTDTTCTVVQVVFGGAPELTTVGWVLGTGVLGSTTVPRPTGWVSGDDLEHPYSDVTFEYDVAGIINESQVTADGGTPQTIEDSTSQLWYGARKITRSLLITSDTEALARAGWDVTRNKAPEVRFPELRVTGIGNDALWPELLPLELSQRVQVRVRPPASQPIVRECYVEQIIHRDVTHLWETTLSLSPAVANDAIARFESGIFDVSVYGY